MTLGGLVLGIGMSTYIFIRIDFEERGLEEELGTPYRRYRESTPMLLPGVKVKAKPKYERAVTSRVL